MSSEYPEMKVEKLYNFWGVPVMAKTLWKLWNLQALYYSIYNYTVDDLDFCDCDNAVGRYSSTPNLVVNYIEKKEDVVWSPGRASLDVWDDWLPVAIYPDGRNPDLLCFS